MLQKLTDPDSTKEEIQELLQSVDRTIGIKNESKITEYHSGAVEIT